MIGFTPDDTLRDKDVIKTDSGLWVAGQKYLEVLDGKENKDKNE